MLPIFKPLVPSGIGYGRHLVVEFEPQSLWYETSLTIAAQAAKQALRVDYHTFQHFPDEIRENLVRLGLDVPRLEQEELLRIQDSYTLQTGFAQDRVKASDPWYTRSLKLSEWSIGAAQQMKSGIRDIDKKRVHIDDNTSVMLQYNQEKEMVDYWRTRMVPWGRSVEVIIFNALAVGVYSETFYKQFELLMDGIFDFKSAEEGNELRHFFRVRMLRGTVVDSKWHRLQLQDNGEVKLVE